MPTHSPVAILDSTTRSVLLGDLRSSLDALDGPICVEHETRVTRRNPPMNDGHRGGRLFLARRHALRLGQTRRS